jgi:hypothetical protein
MQTHVNRHETNCLGGEPNAVESQLLGRCIAQLCRKMLNLTAHIALTEGNAINANRHELRSAGSTRAFIEIC